MGLFWRSSAHLLVFPQHEVSWIHILIPVYHMSLYNWLPLEILLHDEAVCAQQRDLARDHDAQFLHQ